MTVGCGRMHIIIAIIMNIWLLLPPQPPELVLEVRDRKSVV